MAGPIKSWSYSTYTNFMRCPHRVYREKVLKDPRPPLEIPEGKDEHPLERGLRIHTAAELYITEGTELIPELMQFADNMEILRELQKHPDISTIVEEQWAFTKDWNITGWNSEDTWLRMLLDLLMIKGSEGILIDYKSGRRWGNEVTHMTQAQLYQLAAFLRYPELEYITVEFWYTDIGEITQAKYNRKFGLSMLPLFQAKGDAITNEINFHPKPAPWACKYCPYGNEAGSGSCPSAYAIGNR